MRQFNLLSASLSKPPFFASASGAPAAASVMAFLAGAATVIAAANPANHPRAADAISLIAVEAPSMIAALVGIALMALADGLRRRIGASALAAGALSLIAATYFILHHEKYADATMQIGFVGFLILFRNSFYRRARAFSIRLPSAWFIAVAAILLFAVIGAVLWAAGHPAFRTAPWWSLIFDPVLGRAGRPILVAASAFAVILVWRYLATAERTPQPPVGPDDYSRATAIIAAASDAAPEAILAFNGDFAFLFSASGKSFTPYVKYGSGLFALGGPIGPADERRQLLSEFRTLADREQLKPVVYTASTNLLPVLIDLGFRIEKIGENAVVPLQSFSLAGKARESIRYANRKLTQREGARFELRKPPHDAALIERLRPVSEAWLVHQKTAEKRFSLGRFEPAFLDRCLIAEATINEKPIAFGSILATPAGKTAALDLMRYDPATAPPGTMDFLLSEILLWAKEAGYERFDLSMAPLSGLAEEKYAPLFARLGRLVFEQGGRWYNFEGLRNFKEKFRPEWEPRYIASQGALALPVALAEIAMLTNSAAPGPGKD